MLFQKRYKIKFTEEHDTHFKLMMMMLNTILKHHPGMEKDMVEKVDTKRVTSVVIRIKPDTITEDITGKEAVMNEDEIISMLQLSNFITRLLNGPQFIMLRSFIPPLNEATIEKLVQEGADRNETSFENLAADFTYHNALIIRMALIKLHKRESFCRRLRQVMED